MASSETALSVCIVDEFEMVRRGLSGILSDAPDIDVAGVASTPQEAIDLVAAEQPDVVIVDGVPAPPLPRGSYLLIDTLSPDLPFDEGGLVDDPTPGGAILTQRGREGQ